MAYVALRRPGLHAALPGGDEGGHQSSLMGTLRHAFEASLLQFKDSDTAVAAWRGLLELYGQDQIPEAGTPEHNLLKTLQGQVALFTGSSHSLGFFELPRGYLRFLMENECACVSRSCSKISVPAPTYLPVFFWQGWSEPSSRILV